MYAEDILSINSVFKDMLSYTSKNITIIWNMKIVSDPSSTQDTNGLAALTLVINMVTTTHREHTSVHNPAS